MLYTYERKALVVKQIYEKEDQCSITITQYHRIILLLYYTMHNILLQHNSKMAHQ